MSISKKIFRAYDIRGRVADLSPTVMAAIAHALAKQYQDAHQHQVVIGHDARLDSPLYANIFIDIFHQYHFNVIFIGECSSPMLYFSAHQHQGNGIMITASHNPKQDNGIKWILQHQPPSPSVIQQVGEDAIKIYTTLDTQAIPSAKKTPTIHNQFQNYYQQYQDYIVQDIHLTQPIKIVLDGLHGSAGAIAQQLLQQFNLQVIALRCQSNGNFPDHAPDPSVAEHLTTLQGTVIAQQADLGIALDGDGDRIVFIDERGEIIDADRMLCLFAEMCLKQLPHREIVHDVKCSNIVKHAIITHGGQVKMIRTGSSFLRNYLQQSQAIFAGEYSGHYVFNDGRGLGYDDAIYAGLRVIEYLQNTQQTLSQALSSYHKRCASTDLYIPLQYVQAESVIAEFKQQFIPFLIQQQHILATDNVQCSEIDGIRYDFAEHFILLRASNTGDYFTLRFDANHITHFQHVKQQLIDFFNIDYPHIAQAIAEDCHSISTSS